ncbi:MAG: 3-oxoacyl-ACP synthase [Cellulomonadaceae bacterium]|nr:3-oxoacyl-ACP synthase [Cellulomonadaceae bacterium]
MTAPAVPPVPRTYPVRILGTGVHEPSVLVSSTELDERHGRAPGTTQARSGVASRRWAGPDETSSGMAASALRGAVEAAGLRTDDLDAVIVAAVLPEQPMPTTSVLVLRHLGLTGGRAEAFDLNASCLGFLSALQVATLGVAAGRWDRVGVVATELASKGLNHQHLESSALFGDGAGAAVVGRAEPAQSSAVLGLRFATWPEGADLCRVDAGGTRWNVVTPPPGPESYLFAMDGRGLLQHAAAEVPGFLDAFFAGSPVARDAVDVVVPHQASGVGLRYLREKVGFPTERVVDILADHGNQVSASLPTALHAAVTSGRLRRGQTALLLGTGAGLSIGAVLLAY